QDKRADPERQGHTRRTRRHSATSDSRLQSQEMACRASRHSGAGRRAAGRRHAENRQDSPVAGPDPRRECHAHFRAMAIQSGDEERASGQGANERGSEILMDTIRSSDITDKKAYLNRREFIGTALAVAGGAIVNEAVLQGQQPAPHGRKLATIKSPLSATEKPNTWDQITTYNNFYEYDSRAGAGPSELARNFKPEPWTVVVDGECDKRGRMKLEDILKGAASEDRIYRHRCVEAWSM